MRITGIKAFPLSIPIKDGPFLAGGQVTRRDAVLVKVTAEGGLVGYGEAHHARAAGAVAHIVNTVLADIILPHDSDDVAGLWSKVYARQIRTHGLGQASVIALSGIDIALWDLRAKAAGVPLYQLLGGANRPVKAYAGGPSLGIQEPSELVDEAAPLIEAGYRALKLRMGETPARDLARVRAVREAFGPEVAVMVDANTSYTAEDVREVMPGLVELAVKWLEEPFAPHDRRLYREAARLRGVPLAAGENHYTRYEFSELIDSRAVSILQPDVCKVGGLTEFMRVAAMAAGWKYAVCPHSSLTAFSQTTTLHAMLALDNAGYFEGDVSDNPLGRGLTAEPYRLRPDGTVTIGDAPGIGFEPDEAFLAAHVMA